MSTSEHLDGPGGEPVGSARGRGRAGLAIGGGVAALVLVAGAAWAWGAYFDQGVQPAEALPADTLAYVAVDIDPTGQQKVEAIRMLRKFPAADEELGLDTDDDLRRKLFESIQEDGTCADLDYAEDVEPWLGDRVAFAVVPGDEHPEPVFVAQVRDADAAEAGLAALVECGNDDGGEDLGGYAISGDWAVLAETEELSVAVVESAGDDTLEGDDDYQRWTAAAGDPGVLTMYAAPEAGRAILDLAEDGMLGTKGADADLEAGMQRGLEEFPGLAGTLRFDGGAVELEMATGQVEGDLNQAFMTDRGDDVLATLPESTAFALGLGVEEGWVSALLEQFRPMFEADSGMSMDELIAQAEAETGIAIPEDIETLFGDSFSLSLGSDVDLGSLSGEGPGSLPLALKVHGDADAIEEVLDKVRAQVPAGSQSFVLSRQEGEHVVIGPSAAYLDEVAGDGGLGDSDSFTRIVPESEEAGSIVFVNFDADDWLVRVSKLADDPELTENLAPLEAFGASSWLVGDEGHALFRLTTDD